MTRTLRIGACSEGWPESGCRPGPHARSDRRLVRAGLNFVAHGALAGGVSRSLCLDNYGKSLAAIVLRFELEMPEELASSLRGI